MNHMNQTNRVLPIATRALVLAAVAAAIAVRLPAGPQALPVAIAQSPTAMPSAGGACTITDASATTDRTAVPIGGTVRLTLAWRWHCAGRGAMPDILVVVDPSAAAVTIDPDGTAYVANLHLALTGMADRVGFADGQRFGTVIAACPATVAAPLATGEAAHAAWRDGLSHFPVTQQRDLLGALALAHDALAAQPPSDGRPSPVVVVVDNGGSECGLVPAPASADYVAACQRVQDAGATVAVVSTRRSAMQLRGCNTPGWMFRSSNDRGADLPLILDQIAERMVVPNVPTQAFTRIALATGDWDLVDTVPITDIALPEVQWLQPIAEPAAGEVRVTAVLRAGRDAVVGERPLAVAGLGGPSAGLMGAAGDLTALEFDAPAVCIYRRGRAMSDCGVSEPVFAPFAAR